MSVLRKPCRINNKARKPGVPHDVWWVTLIWAVYFFAVFSFGRFEPLTRQIIWIGGGLVTLFTLTFLSRRIKLVERETLLIAGFLGWALLGGFQAGDWQDFFNYYRLSLEMLLVVGLLGAVVRRSGDVIYFYWAFLAVAVYNTIAVALMEPVEIIRQWNRVERSSGLIDNPNGLAFLCFMGILGALGIIGEKTSSKVRAVAVGAAIVAFWGMVAAGSRGAYLSFIIALVLWPLMCINFTARRRWASIAVTILIGVVLFLVVSWIQANTFLGDRTIRTFSRDETTNEERLNLALTALKIAAENPLTGVGLGQFGTVSRSGMYAHNEWAELLATTGLPGFLLFMGVYWSVWRRLNRALCRVRDPVVLYRINFARMTLIILVAAGAVFRPNFIHVDTMFLLALVVGISWWAKDLNSHINRPTNNRQVSATAYRYGFPSQGSSRLRGETPRPPEFQQ